MSLRENDFSRLELRLPSCKANYRYFRSLLEPETKLLVLVKANAYGHGAIEFASMMQGIGVKTIICTDISRDGAMRGTNRELYRRLSETLDMDIIASGGVSTVDDVKALARLGIHGAIIGKAYYTGAIDLKEALEAAK